MTPASLQNDFDQQLDEVASFLKSETSSDLNTQLDNNRKKLADMPAAVRKAVREQFKKDIDRFVAEIEPWAVRVAALRDQVLPQLETAKRHAEEDRLDSARMDYDRAQHAYATALAADLQTGMPAETSPPLGFEQSEWETFRKEKTNQLKDIPSEERGADAADAYQQVWKDYVIVLAERLKDKAIEGLKSADPGRKAKLTDAITAAEDATRKAFKFDPTAVDAYKKAVADYTPPPPPPKMRRQAPATGVVAPGVRIVGPMAAALGAAALGPVRWTFGRTPRGSTSVSSLTAQIKKRQRNLALVTGAIAVLIGLLVLWAPNGTWGGFTDWATLFLWGLGLHELTANFDVRQLGTTLSDDTTARSQNGGGRNQ